MIADLFLTAALAVRPAAAFAKAAPRIHSLIIQHEESEITLQREKLAAESAYVNLILGVNMDSKILVVGGDPLVVQRMRDYGQKAFGALTDDFPRAPLTWQAVSEAAELSFGWELFQSVFWHHSPLFPDYPYTTWLAEAIAVVRPAGYLAFDAQVYHHWPSFLQYMAWIYVPIRSPLIKNSSFSVWQKPDRRSRLEDRRWDLHERRKQIAVKLPLMKKHMDELLKFRLLSAS